MEEIRDLVALVAQAQGVPTPTLDDRLRICGGAVAALADGVTTKEVRFSDFVQPAIAPLPNERLWEVGELESTLYACIAELLLDQDPFRSHHKLASRAMPYLKLDASTVDAIKGKIRRATQKFGVDVPRRVHAENKLPTRPGTFIGREREVSTLKDRLAKQQARIALTGIGGVGKSTLAAWYVHEHGRYDHIFWAAVGGGAVTLALARLAENLLVTSSRGSTAPDVAREVVGRLRRTGSSLLVLDNVRDVTSEEARWLTECKNLCILVTARGPVSGFEEIRIAPPSLPDACRIAGGSSQFVGTDLQDLEDICARLQHLPLALARVALRLNRQVVRPADILPTAVEEGLEVIEALFGSEWDELSPRAHDILAAAAWLSPSGIDRDLLLDAAECANPTGVENLETLVRQGWLRIDQSRSIIDVHEVIQGFVRTKRTDGVDGVARALEQRLRGHDLDDTLGAIAIGPLRPHLEVVMDHDRWIPSLAMALAKHLHAIGEYQRVIAIATRAVSADKNLVDWYEASGLAHMRLGDQVKSVGAIEKALELADGSGSVCAGLHDSLGQASQFAGEHEKAIELFRRAIELSEAAGDSSSSSYALFCVNSGTALMQVGKHSDAEVQLQRGLAILERLKPEHPETAAALGMLGNLCSNLGQHDRADALGRRAVKIREATLGSNHPRLATSLCNLAFSLTRGGHYKEAIETFERALEIRDDNSSERGVIYANLAQAYAWSGQYDPAIENFREAETMLEDSEHLRRAAVRQSLGWTSARRGDYQSAYAYLDQAASLYETGMAKSRDWYKTKCMREDTHMEAAKLRTSSEMERLIGEFEAKFGGNDFDVVTVKVSYSWRCALVSGDSEATARALDTLATHIGRNHPNVSWRRRMMKERLASSRPADQ